MVNFHRERVRPFTPKIQRRLLLASVASAATGGAIYMFVMHLALPAMQALLTPAQVEWLRRAFAEHPVVVLGVIVMLAALLGLPVLGVFRWVYGPLSTLPARRRST